MRESYLIGSLELYEPGPKWHFRDPVTKRGTGSGEGTMTGCYR